MEDGSIINIQKDEKGSTRLQDLKDKIDKNYGGELKQDKIDKMPEDTYARRDSKSNKRYKSYKD